MQKHLVALRVVVILACSSVLSGCFLRRPQPWSPSPIHTPPQAPGEFNALWDGIDENGFPSNPYWEAQTSKYQSVLPPLPGPQYRSCVETPYLTTAGTGEEACTVQPTVIDTPDEFPNILCFTYFDSAVHGHVDWFVAQANGYVSWLNFADDWDYNFRLVPQKQAIAPDQDRGLTLNNNRVSGGDSARYMELEFASSEVADQFRTQWWQDLAKLVDPLNLPELSKYIHPTNPSQDPFAVTVGLFGLDCEHGCRSEFHPVYAMAIQLDENPNSNTWAIFVRNWGDEGFCSSLNHELYLPGDSMHLLLPWPGAKGLSAVVQQISPGSQAPTVDLLQDGQGTGEGALVTFNVPKPSDRGLVETVLRLQWKGGSAVPPRGNGGAAFAAIAPSMRSEGEQDGEQMLHTLKTKAGISRPRISSLAIPPAGAPSTQPLRLKVGRYRRQLAAQKRSLLGERIAVSVECGGPGSAKPCPVDKAKQQRDIALWKSICTGLKGNYPDDKIKTNCEKVEALQ